MVEDVEEVPSELESKAVEDLELTAQRQIELRRSESAKGIASEISVARGRDAECRCVVDLAAGFVRVIEIVRHSGNQIWAL